MLTSSITTLVELLRTRAEAHGTRLAFTYLKDGEEAEDAWTFRDLDRRARQIAAALQQRGSEGDRAILLYPPGLSFIAAFFGCLYARRIAVPISPPNPTRLARELPRVRAILQSAEPRTLLTSASIAPMVEALRGVDPEIAKLDVVSTDALTIDAGTWREPELDPESLAFLQYTSGSTALPKGVMVSHGNLLHNMRTIGETFGTSDETTIVSWLPVFHDMGLIGCVLHPILQGSSTVVMAPAAFLQRPLRWLQAVSRFRAYISGGPNFAYDLCVRRIAPEQRAALDLRSWRVAFNGAEPVRARTIREFTRAFGPCGFQPGAFAPVYGLAEATLLVTGDPEGTPPTIAPFHTAGLERGQATSVTGTLEPARDLVGCGRVVGGQRVVIVEPERRVALRDGEVGEIWIAGPSVAHGYWKQPAETEATFGATLADSGEGPFLRTGDLGFVRGDQLFIAGRRKDLIIVDGRNHYPQDIELSVEHSHPAFRAGCTAAFSIDVDGAERVVVVAEADPHGNIANDTTASGDPPAALFRAARRAISADHDIDLHQLYLVRPGTIAKTTSGKIRRQATRAGFLAGSLQPWDVPAASSTATQAVPPPAPAAQIFRDREPTT
ncbi:MAG: fatty acyl-AMP ligase [Deltaproteobacteria bacterium]|nr:MAG: fatty acyl-AMP ligase [Deltaproteobacteria bacterium]